MSTKHSVFKIYPLKKNCPQRGKKEKVCKKNVKNPKTSKELHFGSALNNLDEAKFSTYPKR